MTDQRTLATRLIAIRVLKDLVAAADAAVRSELDALMLPGDRATAAVYLPDDNHGPGVYSSEAHPVGHVLKTKGSAGTASASIADADALLAWCREHAPTEVHTVELVRTAFQKQLIDTVKSLGGWPDPVTGELLAVDGLTLTSGSPGKPVLQVKPSEGAEEMVRSAWQDGRLSVEDVLALPAKPGAE